MRSAFIIHYLLITTITSSLLTACSQQDCGARLPTLAISVKQHPLTVELAATAKSRTCGLAFRDELAEGHGMLFVFDRDQPLEFWMKDTRMPLSIAFLDAQKRIIDIIDMAEPFSEQRYRSSGSARYALETRLGWFRQQGISHGDQATFDLSADPSR